MSETVDAALEALVYEHLIDLVDFDRLEQLEHLVALQLHNLNQPATCTSVTTIADRASRLITRAWNRLLEDPRRYAEVRTTWQPDEDCALCTLAGLSTPVDS